MTDSMDCSVQCTLAIHPGDSHIEKFALLFYAYLRACAKVIRPNRCEHQRAQTFALHPKEAAGGRLCRSHWNQDFEE